MSLYTKPITNISFEDVKKFCEAGIRENINLDYKQDFNPTNNEKLARSICAFANARGGLIIIGVPENSADNTPDLSKPLGVNYGDKLQDRVHNIVLSHIWPPVEIEVQSCPPVDGKTFVVIRISQGRAAPYAMHGRKEFYIRTEVGNKPEEGLATLEQLEWLLGKRQKSIEFRELKFREMQNRREAILKRAPTDYAGYTEVEIRIAPLYPKYLYCSPIELPQAVRKKEVTRPSDGTHFPPNVGQRPTPEGRIWSNLLDEYGNLFREAMRYGVHHTEINAYGMIYHYQNHCRMENNKKVQFISRLLEDINPAVHFFTRFVGNGAISVFLSIGLNNMEQVMVLNGFKKELREEPVECFDKILSYQNHELTANDLLDNPSKIFTEIGLYFAHAAGNACVSPESVQQWIVAEKRNGLLTLG